MRGKIKHSLAFPQSNEAQEYEHKCTSWLTQESWLITQPILRGTKPHILHPVTVRSLCVMLSERLFNNPQVFGVWMFYMIAAEFEYFPSYSDDIF